MKLKKITSVFLAAVMLVATCTFSADAMAEPTLKSSQLGAAAACDGNTLGTFGGVPACLNEGGKLHICENNFPDGYFRSYLDNEFSFEDGSCVNEDEILQVNSIQLSATGCSSFKGIEFFTSLNRLECDGNNLTELDVSNNTELIELRCGSNKISELNVSNCKKLEILVCRDNQISELDTSQNIKLRGVYFERNNIYNIDLSNNLSLYDVGYEGNHLAQLNLKGLNDAQGWKYEEDDYQHIDLNAYQNDNGKWEIDLSERVSAENLANVTVTSEGAEYDSKTGIITLNSWIDTIEYSYYNGLEGLEGDGVLSETFNPENTRTHMLVKIQVSKCVEPILPDDTDTEYVIGSNIGASVHCSYELSDFVSAAMDGEIVDPENYTLSEGSTILTFNPAYLDTLSVGDHTVTLNYTDATATSVLTIKEDQEETTDLPNEPTSDNDESATDRNEQTANQSDTDTTADSNNAAGTASGSSGASHSAKSPDTGTSYAGVVSAVGAVAISGAVLIFLKKKIK